MACAHFTILKIFLHRLAVQRLSSRFPIGHTKRERLIKRLGMIRVKQMCEFVHDDVIHVFLGIKGKTGVQRDDGGFRPTASPTGAHGV